MSSTALLRLAGCLAVALLGAMGILWLTPGELILPILAGVSLTITCLFLMKAWRGSWLLQFFAIHSLVYFTLKGVMLLYAYFIPPSPDTPLFYALTDPIMLSPNVFDLFAYAVALQALGLIFFFLGSKVRLTRLAVAPKQVSSAPFPWNSLLAVYGICVAARVATLASGHAAGFDVNHEFTSPGFANVALAQLSYMGRIIAAGLVGAGFWRLRNRTLDRFTLVMLIGMTELAWSVLSGSRQHLVITMILSLYALYAFGPPREYGSLKRTTLRIGLAGLVGILGVGMYRWAFISSGASGATGFITAFATIGRSLVTDPLEPVIGTLGALIGRTDVLNTIVRIVDATPSTIPFWGGYAYWQLPAILIPRAIWPDKPSLPVGLLVTQSYYDYGHEAAVYKATGLVGDMYMNFGFWGITIGMLIIGAIYRIISDKVNRLMGNASVPSFLGVGILLSFFILYEQSLYQILEKSIRLGIFCAPILVYFGAFELIIRKTQNNPESRVGG